MIAVQLFVNGLIAGSIYALVASGFSLIYATNRFVHFAHGTTVTVGAYMLFTFFSLLGLNFFIAAFCTVVSTGLLGLLMFLLIYRPLKQRKSSNAILLVASIGLMIFLENLMLLLFGADVKTLAYIPVRKGIELWGAIITPLQIVIIATALLLLCFVWIFTKYTKLGKAMRAVADNEELAEIMGLNARAVQAKSFVLGSGIAGLASVLVVLEQNIEPVMGTGLIIKGFTGAIIGGISSLPGAVLGSYLLGIVENFGIWWLPSGYKDAIAFVLLFLFLLVRPSGILGISKGIKE
ncbi:MAG TPA: branched-chain amino acid ABC transporter permease [Candidatus Andersenbacteria bacterium]|nr:branched-chain amino acid ABC transporter permease [Candidatus Andersenbacteria bacterium]